MSAPPLLTMLTFGPMIDSETARFLLWRYGIPFAEDRHIFGWASVLALFHGGTGQIPLIYGGGTRLTGPRAVIDRFEAQCAPSRMLIPAEQPLRANVEADWITFNSQLAAYTAKIAYFHLLPRRDLMIEPFTRGIPRAEARLTPSLYPALRALFTLLLRLDPKVVADSLAQAHRIADDVDRRMADGRAFLQGEAMTLSDVSFATAAAPLLLPDFYTAPVPPYERLPPALKQIVDSFRRRPSAALVSRVYALRGGRALPKGDPPPVREARTR